MGNDVACKIVNIGTIRIRMHDGIVRTLKNVRHIPDLKKNLIFLGILDSLGYKYPDEGRVIRVSKGSLVMMQCNKVDGLYFLQSSTVTSSVDVSSDTTRLWHMWLGHSKEVELQVEDSQRVQDGIQDQPIIVPILMMIHKKSKRPVLRLVDRGSRLVYLRYVILQIW
jgi:hypothetical protein